VGDPAQAIYGFAGAHPDYLTGLPARFPGCPVLHLTRSYRSTPQVLAAAGRVLADPDADARLVPTRPSGAPVRLVEAATDAAEADALIAAVDRLLASGTSPSDLAVLVRTRSQVADVARRLGQEGVAVSARGASRFFDRPEVRQGVALLAAAARREQTAAALASEPEPATTSHPGLVDTVEAVLADAGWTPQRPDSTRDSRRWDSWSTLVDLARGLQDAAREGGDPAPTLVDLVDDLRERARTGEEPRAAGVTVATLHATKGQEWPQVFVLGAHDGGIPTAAATARGAGPDAIDEERRLLYVGLTRARDGLTVSWARRHRPDQASQRRASRFLQPWLESRDPDLDIRLHPDGPAR
jgi:DNA helicase-2/ATP-dependent DNA helicase PcrA